MKTGSYSIWVAIQTNKYYVKFFDINLNVAENDSTSSLKLLVVFSGGFDTLEFDSASGVSPIETK